MPNPKFSSVIIVYNGERFLAEAIESVIAQSFEDWELIVADDGSTDASGEIAARYAGCDDRIRVISHPDRANHGMSATRNLGVAAARAPLIAFIDCDDAWVPRKLAEQVAIFRNAPMRGQIGILGAGGFIGNRLVEMTALSDGPLPRPIARHAQALGLARRFDLDCRVAEGRDRAALAAALEGCDAVVHAIAGKPS